MAEASLRGFAMAFDARGIGARAGSFVERLVASNAPAASAAAAPALPAEVAAAFPAAVHAMLALGHARVHDYQDGDYAALYLERLRAGAATPNAPPTRPAPTAFAITREMARWLALWMAFDDIVRVAELKSRASRARRVRARSRRATTTSEGLRPLQARRARVRGAAAAAPGPRA